MTDHIDYTVLPEVLEACGLVLHEYADPVENYYTDANGVCRGQRPFLTQAELWDALCKAWEARYIDPLDDEAEELLRKARPALQGMDCVVVWEPGETHFYPVKDYGTIDNAIAAALWTVLQQGKKKEG
jgi:hypothetical protein